MNGYKLSLIDNEIIKEKECEWRLKNQKLMKTLDSTSSTKVCSVEYERT
jgi:hypothetical protein